MLLKIEPNFKKKQALPDLRYSYEVVAVVNLHQ